MEVEFSLTVECSNCSSFADVPDDRPLDDQSRIPSLSSIAY